MAEQRFEDHLPGSARCPHCGVANPDMVRIWRSHGFLSRGTPGPVHQWGVYKCSSCGGAVLAKCKDGDSAANPPIAEVIPSAKSAHEDIPEPARKFLQQAYDTLHAPDAAAVMAGSAVDAMLKQLGYTEGNVYDRIKKAVEDHKLTEGMGQWAHEVRLGSNRPRHADANRPHVTSDEAKQSVEFAEALGFFLFVLTKRVERGTEAAKEASAQAPHS